MEVANAVEDHHRINRHKTRQLSRCLVLLPGCALWGERPQLAEFTTHNTPEPGYLVVCLLDVLE